MVLRGFINDVEIEGLKSFALGLTGITVTISGTMNNDTVKSIVFGVPAELRFELENDLLDHLETDAFQVTATPRDFKFQVTPEKVADPTSLTVDVGFSISLGSVKTANAQTVFGCQVVETPK